MDEPAEREMHHAAHRELLVQMQINRGSATAGGSGANVPGFALMSVLVTLNGEPVADLGASAGNQASAINLPAGWTLRDAQGHVYTFGTYTINAHGYVKIHTGKGTNTQTDRYQGRSWYVWNNTGDTATVKNQIGVVIDKCGYIGSAAGYKIC